MKTNQSSSPFLAACIFLFGTIMAASAATVFDDHFDDGTVTGWESLGNALDATHDITEEGTEITSVITATQANLNTNRGIVNTTAFDPASDPGGFSVTFEVTSQGLTAPGANGMFLGVTSSSTAFYRDLDTPNFGLIFFGHPTRTQSNGGISIATNDISSGGPAAAGGFILDANPNSIELASLQDGFIATISADPTGWSYSVTGLNDTTGTPAAFEKEGTWADAGTDFDSVFGSTSDWYVLATNQGGVSSDTHTVVYDRIALTTGASADEEFRILSITPNLEGDDPGVTLVWASIADAEYAVDVSTDLGEGKWAEVTDGVPSGGEQTEYEHKFLPFFPELQGARRVFYRIRNP